MRAIKLTNGEIATCQVAVSHLLQMCLSLPEDDRTPELIADVARLHRLQGVLANPQKNGREVLQ